MILARLTVPLPGEPSLRSRLRIPGPAFSLACWATALLLFWGRMECAASPASRQLLNGLIALSLLIPVLIADRRDRGVESWLAWRPVRWLGLVAYGTYLAHYPVMHELHGHGVGSPSFGGFAALFFAGGAISLALGTLSYYLLEQPILRWKAGRGGSATGRPSRQEPQGRLAAP
jgi:peptidoglycan/LPS O-acetylase OafA/YrhL